MDWSATIWGLIIIGAGVFISVYGLILFKFALAAMGFSIGFVGGWWLLDGQETTSRFLVALVAGAVLGVLLFLLVRFGVHIAGAILGLVVAIAIGGVIEIIGSAPSDVVMSILAIAGLAGGGIFGRGIGQMIVLLATSAAGALMIVDGLREWYGNDLVNTESAVRTLGSGFALTLFVVLFAISALSQYNSRQLRNRVLNV